MGDQDKGVLIVLKVPFQPLDMLYIQVVCRLVEEQDIRLFKKKLSEEDLRSLSAGELVNVLVKTDLVEAEGASDLLHLGVDNVEVMRHQKILDRSQFLHHGVHLILGRVPHLRADVVHLLLHLKEEGKGTLKHVTDRHALFKRCVLI